jgi:molybdenum cofactor guanylyltransferase
LSDVTETSQAERSSLSALILAGGQSTRMGQDKALVTVQGIPMLLRVCSVAQEVLRPPYRRCLARPLAYPEGTLGGEASLASVSPWMPSQSLGGVEGRDEGLYIVTAWPERYQALTPQGCHFIQEIDPHGPLSGFAQGLAHMETEWVLLLACDLPKIKASTLRSWAETLKDLPPSVMALVARQAKGWEPLCAFYRRASLDSLQHFLNLGGRSFQAWLSQLAVQELALTDQEMLFNCNTPEDVVRAEQI